MLRNPVKREGAFPSMPKSVKKAAHSTNCPCCGRTYGQVMKIGPRLVHVREIVDHVFARRFLTEKFPEFKGVHSAENTVSICNICHGAKKLAEDFLYQGNTLGFLAVLKRINYPLDRVMKMAKILGLNEVEAWRI